MEIVLLRVIVHRVTGVRIAGVRHMVTVSLMLIVPRVSAAIIAGA